MTQTKWQRLISGEDVELTPKVALIGILYNFEEVLPGTPLSCLDTGLLTRIRKKFPSKRTEYP